jgi:hypothetical protein
MNGVVQMRRTEDNNGFDQLVKLHLIVEVTVGSNEMSVEVYYMWSCEVPREFHVITSVTYL